jgi:hypothetical protein
MECECTSASYEFEAAPQANILLKAQFNIANLFMLWLDVYPLKFVKARSVAATFRVCI